MRCIEMHAFTGNLFPSLELHSIKLERYRHKRKEHQWNHQCVNFRFFGINYLDPIAVSQIS